MNTAQPNDDTHDDAAVGQWFRTLPRHIQVLQLGNVRALERHDTQAWHGLIKLVHDGPRASDVWCVDFDHRVLTHEQSRQMANAMRTGGQVCELVASRGDDALHDVVRDNRLRAQNFRLIRLVQVPDKQNDIIARHADVHNSPYNATIRAIRTNPHGARLQVCLCGCDGPSTCVYGS